MARPAKIVCVGVSYADHADETGHERPADPVLFHEGSGSVVGPYEEVRIP